MKTKITIFITLIATFFLFAARDMVTWERDYATDHGDRIYSIKPTSDGGYIAGGSYSHQLSIDWYTNHSRIIKLDSFGNVEWDKPFIWAETGLSCIYSVIENSDGDFVVTGTVGTRDKAIMLLKYDSEGNIIWFKYYGYGGHTSGYEIKETVDKGYIISGTESVNDSVRVASLLKLDSNGDSLWTVTIEKGIRSYFGSTEFTGNGYIATGTSTSDTYQTSGLIMSVDSIGNKLWEKYYGDSLNQIILLSICRSIDGNYICSGSINNYGYDSGYLIKIDENGDSLWSETYDGESITNLVRSIEITTDNNYILSGFYEKPDEYGTDREWSIMKLDQMGDTLWTRKYGFTEYLSDDDALEIHQTSDGGYIVGGFLGYHSYVMKLNEYGQVGIEDSYELLAMNYELEQNYPNPFNNQTRINYALDKISDVKISVFNAQGQKVSELVNNKVGKGRHSVMFDGSRFNSGVYYYRLSVDGDIKDTRKMIYLR